MTEKTPPTPTRRRRTAALTRTLLAVCPIAAGALLAACGSSGSPTTGSPTSIAQDAFKFSQCMREHGIANFPDPESSGGAVRLKFKVGEGASPQKMEAAQSACKRYSPAEKEKLTPAQRAEREEAGLKFAKCMREHGVNIPNPSTSDAGVRIHLGGPASGGPNPESPAFQAAQKACQGLLPKLKGAGAGLGAVQAGGPAGSGSGPAISAGG